MSLETRMKRSNGGGSKESKRKRISNSWSQGHNSIQNGGRDGGGKKLFWGLLSWGDLKKYIPSRGIYHKC